MPERWDFRIFHGHPSLNHIMQVFPWFIAAPEEPLKETMKPNLFTIAPNFHRNNSAESSNLLIVVSL
ncbi:MAG: hypothetical protein JWR26_2961 [Pedosphaera sp.]|nr:hypothetical protein [Pedosphaera sp.]